MWLALGLLAVLVGIAGAMPLWYGAYRWAAVVSIGAGIALLFGAVRLAARDSPRQHAREERRLDTLEKAGAGSMGEYEIRRGRVTRWPTIITILFGVPPLIFLAINDWQFAATFLVFSAMVSLVAWIVAWSLGAGVIATLTPSGIAIRGEEISWQEIASLDLHFLPHIETGQLVIRLLQPRAPRTFAARLSAWLSAGVSDSEIVVSLARSKEPAGVVFHLAQMRWESAIGSRRAHDALERERDERAREARTWRRFTAAEKMRTVWIAAGMFVLFGFAIHGVHADFRVSGTWLAVSLPLAAAIGVWGAVALLRSRLLLRTRSGQGAPNYIALFCIISVSFGAMIGSTFARSWPDLLTRSAGREAARDVPYDKSGYRGEKGCRHPLSLRLDTGRPHRWCTQPAAFAALPDEGTLRVELRQSWLGVHIVRVSTLED